MAVVVAFMRVRITWSAGTALRNAARACRVEVRGVCSAVRGGVLGGVSVVFLFTCGGTSMAISGRRAYAICGSLAVCHSLAVARLGVVEANSAAAKWSVRATGRIAHEWFIEKSRNGVNVEARKSQFGGSSGVCGSQTGNA